MPNIDELAGSRLFQFRLTRLYRAGLALHCWAVSLDDGGHPGGYTRTLCRESLQALLLVASAGASQAEAERTRNLKRVGLRITRCVAALEAMSQESTIPVQAIALGQRHCVDMDQAIDGFADELKALWMEIDEETKASVEQEASAPGSAPAPASPAAIDVVTDPVPTEDVITDAVTSDVDATGAATGASAADPGATKDPAPTNGHTRRLTTVPTANGPGHGRNGTRRKPPSH